MEELTHFHLFAGGGGGAAGGHHLEVHVQGLHGRFRCLGGVDVAPDKMRAFSRYVGTPATVLDLFSVDQYRAFHGAEPPADWREATPEDLQRAAGGEAPDIVVSSPPCKGFSSLLSESKSRSAKYRALNGLTLRGIDLALRAWADDPPAFWLLENVPRLVNRGRELLAEIVARLEASGYEVTYSIPDLGELGGLAQSRKRLHLVARHRERCPVWVFEPPRQRLRSIGEVLGPLPMPGTALGPLHYLPRLAFWTWVRLALIRAGKDWRDLQRLAVANGRLRDFALAPEEAWQGGVLGVMPWSEPSLTVTGRSQPFASGFAVQDPRAGLKVGYAAYGVQRWGEAANTVMANGHPGGGRIAVADPRFLRPDPSNYRTAGHYGVRAWDETSGAVTASARHDSGPWNIADPRMELPDQTYSQVYAVADGSRPARTVAGATRPGSGALVIPDPRPAAIHFNHAYRLIGWDDACVAVTAGSAPSSGGISVADPRIPNAEDRGVWYIRALDGTWHRPTSVIERAALQGLLDPMGPEHFARACEGMSATAASELVGNAIPPASMAAALRSAGVAILLSRAGHGFALGSTPIWVRPFARGLLAGGEA